MSKYPLWGHLSDAQYQRLCACMSTKKDICPIAECFVSVKKLKPEDAIIRALEHLECNGNWFDLTKDEYDSILSSVEKYAKSIQKAN